MIVAITNITKATQKFARQAPKVIPKNQEMPCKSYCM